MKKYNPFQTFITVYSLRYQHSFIYSFFIVNKYLLYNIRVAIKQLNKTLKTSFQHADFSDSV